MLARPLAVRPNVANGFPDMATVMVRVWLANQVPETASIEESVLGKEYQISDNNLPDMDDFQSILDFLG